MAEQRIVTHIVWHSVGAATKKGTPYVSDPSIDDIRRYHMAHNGWSDVGYHFGVRLNGRVEKGRPVAIAGSHVGGFNRNSIGIVFSGHGDIQDLTPEQVESGIKLTCDQLEEHKVVNAFLINNMRVLGHRECYALPKVPNTGKTCPGTKVDMTAIRKRVALELKRRGHK